jgi:CheY-like chemotaxis protein
VSRIAEARRVYLANMPTSNTLLCIHREPAQLSLLQENGYQLVIATNGSDGLRLFKSRSVDAIVLEYQLGLLDSTVIADEIKQARPEIPIVLLTEHLELPNGALKSVDALVTKADGAHFLLAAVHFMLNVRPAQRRDAKLRAAKSLRLPAACRSRERTTVRTDQSWKEDRT